MDSQQLENSPSRKAPQSTKLAVFSSIENRGDILEGRNTNKKHQMTLDEHIKKNSQNIRPLVMDSISTKRYSISQQTHKDNFYAIHHSQRSIKEHSDENNSSSPETPSAQQHDVEIPSFTTTTKHSKKSINLNSNNRGRKRILASDQTKPSSSSTTTAADSTNTSNNQSTETAPPPVKRNKKSRQRKSIEPTLYQTCDGLWPPEQQLGDLSHDNIKALSNLLKVRLSQAKFKMMAKLDQDNELFTFLAEEYVPPRPRLPHSIRLSSARQNKSCMAVVGNGKNLLSRNNKSSNQQQKQQQQQQQQQQEQQHHGNREDNSNIPSTPKEQHSVKLEFATSPHRSSHNLKTKERKKRTPRTPGAKVRRPNATPKRKSAAADIPPVILSDGTAVFICEPCNKRYKNRGGLAYHLERCKHAVKNTYTNHTEDEENDDEDEEEGNESNTAAATTTTGGGEEDAYDDSTIHCVCGSVDEHGTMIQCDKCRAWLHSDCIGLSEEDMATEDSFICTNCKPIEVNTPHSPNTRDLLQCLLEAQASDYDQLSLSSQEQTSPAAIAAAAAEEEEEGHSPSDQQLQELFNPPSTMTRSSQHDHMRPSSQHEEEEQEQEQEEEEKEDELFSMPMDFVTANNEMNSDEEEEEEEQEEEEEDNQSEADNTTTTSNLPGSTQLHVWDDFSFENTATTTTSKQSNNEPWSILDDGGENDAPFSTANNNYETDIPSSSCWAMNDLSLFSQPPSLLFSDATMSSALEEVGDLNSSSAALIGDLVVSTPQATAGTPMNNVATPMSTAATPINHISTPCNNSVNTPIHTTADGLWFQFANFDDDYQES